jgi:hypothetical protein
MAIVQPTGERSGVKTAVSLVGSAALGLALGLLLSWVLRQVGGPSAGMADLPLEDKEQYTVLVGAAYALDGDLARAQARLEALGAPNTKQWVADLADRSLADGWAQVDIQALAALAHGLGVDSPRLIAYLATPTPPPTDTPAPTATPLPTEPPTATPVPPTDTPLPPTETPLPTATDTPPPLPTDTPLPPTDTPRPTSPPQPTNTRVPPTPTSAPKPAKPTWTWNAWLVGPGQDSQGCDYGNLQIRVTVEDAQGKQIPGVWIYDQYTREYKVTGHKGDDPFWGPGEAEFLYGAGGGSLCVANGQGGSCVSDFTRDLPCYSAPPVEDLFAAGYCDQCCDRGISLEDCRKLVAEGKCMGFGHYSWRVVFKRSW